MPRTPMKQSSSPVLYISYHPLSPKYGGEIILFGIWMENRQQSNVPTDVGGNPTPVANVP